MREDGRRVGERRDKGGGKGKHGEITKSKGKRRNEKGEEDQREKENKRSAK